MKMILAAGTNNIIKNSAEEILQAIEEIHGTLVEKFPNASIWIQFILPRLFVSPKVLEKIREINEKLFEKFGPFFFNPHNDFVTEKGGIRRDFLRRDGLHPSHNGNNKLASSISKILNG